MRSSRSHSRSAACDNCSHVLATRLVRLALAAFRKKVSRAFFGGHHPCFAEVGLDATVVSNGLGGSIQSRSLGP